MVSSLVPRPCNQFPLNDHRSGCTAVKLVHTLNDSVAQLCHRSTLNGQRSINADWLHARATGLPFPDRGSVPLKSSSKTYFLGVVIFSAIVDDRLISSNDD